MLTKSVPTGSIPHLFVIAPLPPVDAVIVNSSRHRVLTARFALPTCSAPAQAPRGTLGALPSKLQGCWNVSGLPRAAMLPGK